MRIFFFLLLTILIHQNSHSQFVFNNVDLEIVNPPKSSYKIIQYRNGEVTRIEQINNNGKKVFEYKQGDIPPFFNWKSPHRFIYANEYDTEGNIIKRYSFNSNAGHDIYFYEYDKEKSTKTFFKRSFIDLKKNPKNSNAFSNISRITSLEQLKKSSEVTNIMSSPKIQGYVEFLNQENRPILKKEYSKTYRDSTITTIKYNSKGNEIDKTVFGINSKEIKRKTIYEYPDEFSKITRIINYDSGEESSVYQFAETNNNADNTKTNYSESRGKLNIRHHIFDNSGRLIRIIVYETDFENKLIVPISKDFYKTAEMQYSYNKEGLLEREKMTNYKTGLKETRKYKYQIETE